MSKMYSYSTSSLGSIMNQAKDIFVRELARQKILTKDQAESLVKEWALICVEKGWLGSSLDRILFKQDDKDPSPIIKLVKLLDDAPPECEKVEETEELLMQMIKDRPKGEVLTHPNATIRKLANKIHFEK